MPHDPQQPDSPYNEDKSSLADPSEPSTGNSPPMTPGHFAVPMQAEEANPSVKLGDVHSLPVAVPEARSAVSEAQVATAEQPPSQNGAAGTVAQATQAVTHAVAQTAKEATQQVAATVQEGAQKITVAPRKAIYRGKRFLVGYGVLTLIFGALAFFARRHRHFPADVGITRLVQGPNLKPYDGLMHAVSELGWRWMSVGTRAAVSTLMWAAGFRMESAFTLSTWSGDVVSALIKVGVTRPRPTKDLVRVVSELKEASFPSGHVVHYVTFYGFLFYLVFTHLKQRWFRTALLTLLGGIILLVGPSRIYMGHHWPSDVGGAYFVGTLWLGVIIIAYLETKANYTLHTHPPFLVKRAKQLG
jgi:membrane-associated phospholipid phosphatase